jgi:cellulose synthase/poly-beta-1,6-N-acetylglucosamine synthase-like glycosyltransferase
MQQLGVRSESTTATSISTEVNLAAEKIPPLTTSTRIIGVLLLFLPGLFLLLFLLLGLDMQTGLSNYLGFLIFVCFFSGIIQILEIVRSLFSTRRNTICRQINRFKLLDSPKIQPVSILFWAYNCKSTFEETIKSLLTVDYPEYELIVINDGSTDETLKMLKNNFALEPISKVFRRSLATSPIDEIYSSAKYPILTVVSKPHTGKADSLNIGLNLAKAPLVCIVDYGHVLSRDALVLLAKPFIEDPGSTVMTSSTGETQADDGGSEDFVRSMKLVERKRLFHTSYTEQAAFCIVNGIENAITMVRKSYLLDLGGFKQDLEMASGLVISTRLQSSLLAQEKDYRFCFIPDIICWRRTRVGMKPSYRRFMCWQAYLLYALVNNLRMFTNKKSFLQYLKLLFALLLPVFELVGILIALVALVLGETSLAILYLFASAVFALLESLGAIVADEFSLRHKHSLSEVMTLIFASVGEATIYRHRSNLWRLVGACKAVFTKL